MNPDKASLDFPSAWPNGFVHEEHLVVTCREKPIMLSCILAFAISSAAQDPGAVHIRNAAFDYETGAVAGAKTWTNLQTHTRLQLGGNPEVEIEVGERPDVATKVRLWSTDLPNVSSDGQASDLLYRSDDGSLTVEVHLAADREWPVLHKWAEVKNTGASPTRILNVVLGRFPVGHARADGGERGFPLYLDDQFFVGLAHPAGFAHVEGGNVVLRQYPGARLAPGGSFKSMEAVYGVSKPHGAKKL